MDSKQENQAPIDELIAECEEIIERMSRNLTEFEGGIPSVAKIEEIYRDMHTLKGSAYLFGFKGIGRIAHALETCLEPLREKPQSLDSMLVTTFFECLDLIVKAVQSLSTTKQESIDEIQSEEKISQLLILAKMAFGHDKCNLEVASALAPTLSSESEADASSSASASSELETPGSPVNVEASTSLSPAREEKTEHVNQEGGEESAQPAFSSETSVRVKTTLLDKLMNLAGELVLVRNQVLQFSKVSEDLQFLNLSQRLDSVTSELQDHVMRTRMQPISNVLNRFHRVVRDLSMDSGKDIALKINGGDTEIDRSLLEAVKDPLMHVIRNACDHGIEDGETRKKAGKSPEGIVTISAFHEGGQVLVVVSDDGKGLDKERLVHKALEQKLIHPEDAKVMSEKQIFDLIFVPGFSTAQKVSAVSGRGVGMDVVRTNVEKIGGSVEVSSLKGRGTQLTLKIPLTLAIVPAMIVRSGADCFAIPQVKLVELVRVENGEEGPKIEDLHEQKVYRLRGDLLPLIELRSILGGSDKGRSADQTSIVVLDADGYRFGLIVDEVLDTADIVVKPLGSFLKSLALFSGATIMGDGAIALILDVTGIAEKLNLRSESLESKETLRVAESNPIISQSKQEYLLFKLAAPGLFAVPLFLVNRLEEFARDSFEVSGEQFVVRYRGSILPIISLCKFLALGSSDTEGREESDPPSTASVIVVSRGGRSFGIHVHEILDVIEGEQDLGQGPRDRNGVMGNLICDGQVVVVVDVMKVLEEEAAKLHMSLMANNEEQRQVNSGVKVALVEDTVFFKRHISRILEDEGYKVSTFSNGLEAFEYLKDNPNHGFDLIVSDIEMPQMDGIRLVKSLRSLDQFKEMPIVALTTKTSKEHHDNGLEAGFDHYLEKLDTHGFLLKIKEILNKGDHKERSLSA